MLLRSVIEILSPTGCINCSVTGAMVCLECLRMRAHPYSPRCYSCGWGNDFGRVCIFCQLRTPLSGAIVACSYRGIVRDMIVDFKQRQNREICIILGALVARKVLRSGVYFSVVTSIPVSPQRYRERGFNQAEQIAKRVAKDLCLPYVPMLGRLSSTHQVGQGRESRLRQVEGAFYILKPHRSRNERILVVDDVLTTGATLGEAAKELKMCGAIYVWGAAVARSKT